MIDHAILRLRSQHGHHSLKLLYNDITNMGHLDAVSADKTSLGFEFQDLVFIEKLLELKPGESLGLEVLDDIHLETISSKFLLYQVKHSLSGGNITRSEEHTSELQSHSDLVCRLLLEKKKKKDTHTHSCA